MEDKSQISDGYHTFAELYEHRYALFLALVKTMPEVFVRSWNHSDGKPCFGGDDWFIVIGVLPEVGQISYHLPRSLWSAAEMAGIANVDVPPEWDSHSSADVVNRLLAFAIKQPS